MILVDLVKTLADALDGFHGVGLALLDDFHADARLVVQIGFLTDLFTAKLDRCHVAQIDAASGMIADLQLLQSVDIPEFRVISDAVFLIAFLDVSGRHLAVVGRNALDDLAHGQTRFRELVL